MECVLLSDTTCKDEDILYSEQIYLVVGTVKQYKTRASAYINKNCKYMVCTLKLDKFRNNLKAKLYQQRHNFI